MENYLNQRSLQGNSIQNSESHSHDFLSSKVFVYPKEIQIPNQRQRNLQQMKERANSMKNQQKLQIFQKKQENKQKLNKKLNKSRQKLNTKKLSSLIKQFQIYLNQKQQEQLPKMKLSLKQIAQNFNFSRSTISKLYNEYIYDPTLTQRLYILCKKYKRKTFQEVNKDRMQSVKKILNNNPYLTQQQLLQKLHNDNNIIGKKIKLRTLGRILQVMKYTKQKIIKNHKNKNSIKNIQRRFEYCTFYKNVKQKNKNVYFISLASFNSFTVRDMAWTVRGHSFQEKDFILNEQLDIVILALMGEKGVLSYTVQKGQFTKESYLNFFNEFLNSFEKKNGIQKSYIVADNCQIYDYLETEGILFKSNNIDMICLPPHSPQLNPIDCWFHQLKAKVRKKMIKGQKQIIQETKRIIESYKQFDFQSYFKVVMIHVERGIKKEFF